MSSKRFARACDASAATRIAGTSCFVTASDEDYVLRVYDWNTPGLPITDLDVTSFLEPVNTKKEPDIEGSAQIGDRIYWIGSHGRDKDGVAQESRHRLFATDVTLVSGRPTLQPVGKPYKNLLNDLSTGQGLKELGLLNAADLKPEDPGGLNIEGLTSTPEGHLLVGFRNPIPQNRALIVRIQNPAEVVAGSAAANVSREALIDLGGRGVRALEPTADGKLFVLAGAFNDEKRFALFRWDGGSTPTQLLDGAALNELNPEELLAWPEAAGAVQFLSDDGEMPVGDRKCKKVEVSNRSFRVTAVPVTV